MTEKDNMQIDVIRDNCKANGEIGQEWVRRKGGNGKEEEGNCKEGKRYGKQRR